MSKQLYEYLMDMIRRYGAARADHAYWTDPWSREGQSALADANLLLDRLAYDLLRILDRSGDGTDK